MNGQVPPLGTISSLLVRFLNGKRPTRGSPLSHFERLSEALLPGDVILVEGRTRVSDVIRWITQSPWTHAALYLGKLSDITDAQLLDIAVRHVTPGTDANQRLVIESQLGLGTVVRPLTVYELDHLRICRPRNLNGNDRQAVLRFAISRLGTPYDVRQIFDLLRFLFPWFIIPRRWRSSLFTINPGESTKTVCSTMIAEAFSYVDFPILPLVQRSDQGEFQLFRRNPKLCTPSDFDYSPYFDIVKYPFLDIAEHKGYRLLPWTGDEHLPAQHAGEYLGSQQKVNEAVVTAAIERSAALGKMPDSDP